MSKNLLYSYWLSRPVLPGAEYAAKQMAAYAAMVGADYRFDRHSPFMDRYGVEARWFDKLRPCFDPSFARYDRVGVVDSDVFPVDGLTASIFDEPCGDFGMVEEPDQPEFRDRWPTPLFNRKADEAWAAFVERAFGSKPPRDAKGRPRTWNAGVILFSQAGRKKLETIRPTPREYVAACRKAKLLPGVSTEQGYLNTVGFLPGVVFTELSLEWNRTIQKIGDGSTYDRRNPATKFVHVMLRGADHNDSAWHHAIVNAHLPPAPSGWTQNADGINLPPKRPPSALHRPLF